MLKVIDLIALSIGRLATSREDRFPELSAYKSIVFGDVILSDFGPIDFELKQPFLWQTLRMG